MSVAALPRLATHPTFGTTICGWQSITPHLLRPKRLKAETRKLSLAHHPQVQSPRVNSDCRPETRPRYMQGQSRGGIPSQERRNLRESTNTNKLCPIAFPRETGRTARLPTQSAGPGRRAPEGSSEVPSELYRARGHSGSMLRIIDLASPTPGGPPRLPGACRPSPLRSPASASASTPGPPGAHAAGGDCRHARLHGAGADRTDEPLDRLPK